jgi:hypothetical protein
MPAAADQAEQQERPHPGETLDRLATLSRRPLALDADREATQSRHGEGQRGRQWVERAHRLSMRCGATPVSSRRPPVPPSGRVARRERADRGRRRGVEDDVSAGRDPVGQQSGSPRRPAGAARRIDARRQQLGADRGRSPGPRSAGGGPPRRAAERRTPALQALLRDPSAQEECVSRAADSMPILASQRARESPSDDTSRENTKTTASGRSRLRSQGREQRQEVEAGVDRRRARTRRRSTNADVRRATKRTALAAPP